MHQVPRNDCPEEFVNQYCTNVQLSNTIGISNQESRDGRTRESIEH